MKEEEETAEDQEGEKEKERKKAPPVGEHRDRQQQPTPPAARQEPRLFATPEEPQGDFLVFTAAGSWLELPPRGGSGDENYGNHLITFNLVLSNSYNL